MSSDNMKDLVARLREPFPVSEVKWRASGQPTNGSVMMIPYLDARNVMDRLDEVFGMDCWDTTYTQVGPRDVLCTINIRIGERSFAKSDVGTANDGVSNDLVMKSAYSDSLKRAAVHLGIGRYLYAVSYVRVPVNSQGFPAYTPQMPEWAMNEEDRRAAAEKPLPVVHPLVEAPKQQQPQQPQTQRLGGDGRQQQQPQAFVPDVEVVLPAIESTQTHQELWKQLGPDDREFAIKVGNAIGKVAGPTGDRLVLRQYYDEYSRRENVPHLVRCYLDAFLLEAWANTPPKFVKGS